MSIEMREMVADALLYQNPQTQKPQFTDTDASGNYIIDTNLIQALYEIVIVHHITFVVTAIRLDHNDDSCLGPYSHAAGRAIDGWFLDGPNPTDYMDPTHPSFAVWLAKVRNIMPIAQIGLGGSAYNDTNLRAIAPIGFADNGSDHIHIGVS